MNAELTSRDQVAVAVFNTAHKIVVGLHGHHADVDYDYLAWQVAYSMADARIDYLERAKRTRNEVYISKEK